MKEFFGIMGKGFQMSGTVHLILDVGYRKDTGDTNKWFEGMNEKRVRVMVEESV